MRRLIAVAMWMLVAAAGFAQLHGTPPSVTSLRPGADYSNAPLPSVTSIGHLGWNFQPSPLGVSPFAANGLHRRRFGRFRGSSLLTAIPIIVPYYTLVPGYPLLYPPFDPAAAYAAYSADQGTDPAVDPTVRRIMPAPDSAAMVDPAPASSNPPRKADNVGEQQSTVLVFQDGHRLEISNYAIVGRDLFNFSGPGPRRINLADLDLKATQQANDDRGIEFDLPAPTK
jgi:hypothetical protein